MNKQILKEKSDATENSAKQIEDAKDKKMSPDNKRRDLR